MSSRLFVFYDDASKSSSSSSSTTNPQPKRTQEQAELKQGPWTVVHEPQDLDCLPFDTKKEAWQAVLEDVSTNVQLNGHGLSAAGRDHYVAKKVKPYESYLPRGKDFSFAIMACWPWFFEDEFKNDMRLLFSPNKKSALNSDKPELYSFEMDDREWFVLRVSPGADYVRVYAQSFWFFFASHADWFGKVSFGVFESLDAQLGMYSFGPQPPTDFSKETGLWELSEKIKETTVVIGDITRIEKTIAMHLNLDEWYVDGNTTPCVPKQWPIWSWKTYNHIKGNKVLLLGSKLTFRGNLAHALSNALIDLGAEEIVYVGAKVGSLTTVEMLNTPNSFVIGVSNGAHYSPFKIHNEFSQTTTNCETHLAVPSPLDLNYEFIINWKRKFAFNTVDTECAYVAHACHSRKKRFGAFYVTPAYLVGDTESKTVTDFNTSLGTKKKNYRTEQDENEMILKVFK